MSQDVSENKNPYEVLGFAVLSLFNSMRFFSLIYFLMALIMMLCGIKNYNAAPVNLSDLSATQMLAMTNLNQSLPVCI